MEDEGRGQAGSAMRTRVPDVWLIHGMEKGVAVCRSERGLGADQPRHACLDMVTPTAPGAGAGAGADAGSVRCKLASEGW